MAKIKEITDELETQMASVTSITQVAEVLYYSVFAAALLQRMAKFRQDTMPKNKDIEETVMDVLSGVFSINLSEVADEDDSLSLRKFSASENFEERYSKEIKMLSKNMMHDFAWDRKVMRALAILSISNYSALKSDKYNGHLHALNEFIPVQWLLVDYFCRDFPVIGTLKTDTHVIRGNRNHSPVREECQWLEDSTNADFNQVVASKLAELLHADEMLPIDRARIEEIRSYCLQVLCKSFFNLEEINLPRVFSLLKAVEANSTNDGLISETELNRISPTECQALLSRETILTKSSVDMNATWYRANDGVKYFIELVKRFNLLSCHILDLL